MLAKVLLLSLPFLVAAFDSADPIGAFRDYDLLKLMNNSDATGRCTVVAVIGPGGGTVDSYLALEARYHKNGTEITTAADRPVRESIGPLKDGLQAFETDTWTAALQDGKVVSVGAGHIYFTQEGQNDRKWSVKEIDEPWPMTLIQQTWECYKETVTVSVASHLRMTSTARTTHKSISESDASTQLQLHVVKDTFYLHEKLS